MHRDIKLKNILMNKSEIKIADFGLSKVGEQFKISVKGTTFLGTPVTRAP